MKYKVPEFKDIPNFPGYRACSDGSIWTCWKKQGTGHKPGSKHVISDRWKKLKGEVCYPKDNDYRLKYTLTHENGKRVRKFGSHWIAIAFYGPCPPEQECCHNDGNCLNNAADNLRWDTKINNEKDKVKHNTIPCGERNGFSKLTTDNVREIRRRRKNGESCVDIARCFNIKAKTVSYICNKRLWKHVS